MLPFTGDARAAAKSNETGMSPDGDTVMNKSNIFRMENIIEKRMVMKC